jgi:hypothetical protein
MFRCEVKCGTETPIRLVLPSACDIKDNPDTIFTNTATEKDHCQLIHRLTNNFKTNFTTGL